jgi:hypothetical protein
MTVFMYPSNYVLFSVVLKIRLKKSKTTLNLYITMLLERIYGMAAQLNVGNPDSFT